MEPWNAVIETGFVSEATFGQKFRYLSAELIQHDDNVIDEVDYDGDDEMMTKLNILKPFPLLVHEQQCPFAPISSTEMFEKKDVNTIMTIYNYSVTIRTHHYDHKSLYPL